MTQEPLPACKDGTTNVGTPQVGGAGATRAGGVAHGSAGGPVLEAECVASGPSSLEAFFATPSLAEAEHMLRELDWGQHFVGVVMSAAVGEQRMYVYSLKEAEGIVFVHGSGKRKSPLQKSIETLEEYLAKLKEYTQKLHICGQRNSYAKTDHDATFMRMKEDAMRNGQLKAGYNLQHGVDSEYIVWLNIGPQPTDTTTLIPFLKEMD